jgi:UDPglucose 6-dehydrogenase
MNIAVIGTGYVGITTSASLGELGHQVIGVDIDKKKIQQLQKGILPIYEPGVEPLIQKQLKEGTLQFTTSIKEGINNAEVVFIAVGTPSLPDGHPNMTYVEEVAAEIGRYIDTEKIIVNKSTVPVGTADRVREIVEKELANRNLQLEIEIDIVSNPEFLQEGKALEDARRPDRIILGCGTESAKMKMLDLYKEIDAPKLITSPRNAEMIKYASNAFLAAKISFINEIAKLCHELSVDVTDVAKGMGMDQRIGHHFLRAGIGFGGSCFPKDVLALQAMAMNSNMEMSILREVQKVNETQPGWFVNQISRALKELRGKRIALLGLSFKPDTDDIREAPSLKLIPQFMQQGAFVIAYDPIVNAKIKDRFPDLILARTAYDAAQSADAIVLCTEWQELVDLDWERVRKVMRGRHIFDGRNALDPIKMRSLGLRYWGVGRNEKSS